VEKCSFCGRPVTVGEYMEVDGKTYCFDCGSKGPVANTNNKEKPQIISCPNCNTRYDYNQKKCPHCDSTNPVFQFHAGDFITNVVIGYITALIIPLLLISVLVTLFRGSDGTGIALVLGLGSLGIINMIFSLILIVLLYYIGGWMRNKLSKYL
jgi:ribosomal protein L24E